MLGPEGVAVAVATRLRETMPAKIEELWVRFAADPVPANSANLPKPKPGNIHAQEIDTIAIGEYPSIMVTIRDNGGRTAPMRNSDHTGTYAEYQLKYRVRLYFYVHGSTYGPTALQRYRFVLAIRECLLARRGLLVTETENVVIEELTYAEELEGGVGEITPGQLIGSGAVSFDVRTTERLAVGGPVQTVEIVQKVEPVPPSAPMPPPQLPYPVEH